MLLRDVDNLRRFFGRFAPMLLGTDFGNEIWARYQAGTLTPDATLTGQFATDDAPVDLESVLDEIDAVRLEEAARQMRIRERE